MKNMIIKIPKKKPFHPMKLNEAYFSKFIANIDAQQKKKKMNSWINYFYAICYKQLNVIIKKIHAYLTYAMH